MYHCLKHSQLGKSFENDKSFAELTFCVSDGCISIKNESIITQATTRNCQHSLRHLIRHFFEDADLKTDANGVIFNNDNF